MYFKRLRATWPAMELLNHKVNKERDKIVPSEMGLTHIHSPSRTHEIRLLKLEGTMPLYFDAEPTLELNYLL